MKKCPFCAEEIQDKSRLCRWCGKELAAVKFSLEDFLRNICFGLLALAMFSFFMPFVRFEFPMMGDQAFSGAGVVAQAFNGAKDVKPRKPSGRLKIDVSSVYKLMKSPDGLRVFQSKPVYMLIPVGLGCGALAYFLLIFIAVFLWMKKTLAAGLLAACACSLAAPFLISIRLLDDLLQFTINSSIGSLHDNPFANLAVLFMQGIRIEPDQAIYYLAGSTFLIVLIHWIMCRYCLLPGGRCKILEK